MLSIAGAIGGGAIVIITFDVLPRRLCPGAEANEAKKKSIERGSLPRVEEEEDEDEDDSSVAEVSAIAVTAVAQVVETVATCEGLSLTRCCCCCVKF